ncbi:hypothetical protein [Geotalea sp. SG265]|uniref:hypothetical protein n=1 Tax=Geotalea sp. SG265 TaxID=2922867 RepID=UPI001FAFDB1A|nr:hypothetical protein [Geotalea sp. SG265]
MTRKLRERKINKKRHEQKRRTLLRKRGRYLMICDEFGAFGANAAYDGIVDVLEKVLGFGPYHKFETFEEFVAAIQMTDQFLQHAVSSCDEEKYHEQSL